jgi:trehalose/maltose hydrolase-like predicted phosphorylase
MIGGLDGWNLHRHTRRVRDNRAIEGLFTLGSGFLHIRGSHEIHFANDPQNVEFTRLPANVTSEQFRATKAKWGTYVPGIFGKHPLLGNELINLPWFCGMEIELDGQRFSWEKSHGSVFSNELLLDNARILRQLMWTIDSGLQVKLSFERFISAARPDTCVQRLMLTPVGRTAHARVRAVLDTDVRTNGFDHLPSREISVIHPNGIRAYLRTDSGDQLLISAYLSTDVGEISSEVDGRRGWSQVSVTLDDCESLCLSRITVVRSSHSGPRGTFSGTPVPSIARHFRENNPANELLAEHKAAWNERWVSCDVEIDGDPESQLAIRVALYHLLRCHVDDPRVAIDAKGYSGDAYWGRFFWDTEMFLLPFYLYTAPQRARTLVDFRVNTLPGARRNAARYGYPGARYAWESDAGGDECCPNWQYADHEVHVTADVVYGLVHFAAATGDDAYLRGAPAEVLIETARYWMGRIDWCDRLEGTEARRHEAERQPVLLGVMGPDEYTPISDNNAYTNRMVAFALKRTAEVAEHCSQSSGTEMDRGARPGDTAADEIAGWRHVATRLPMPRHPDDPRIVLQCDGFEKLAEPRFDGFWKDRDKTYASQVSQERLYRSKCLKQADVLMLVALFSHEFSDDEVRAAWDYYLPYTTHDSSLSPGIHALIACRLGMNEQAWDFWKRSCAVDLDIERGGAAEGVHIANFGAMWQIVVFGFAGVRSALQSERLTLHPRLPAKWSRLRFPLVWKGTRVRVEIEHGRVRVSNVRGGAIEVSVLGDTKSVGPGMTVAWGSAGEI